MRSGVQVHANLRLSNYNRKHVLFVGLETAIKTEARYMVARPINIQMNYKHQPLFRILIENSVYVYNISSALFRDRKRA